MLWGGSFGRGVFDIVEEKIIPWQRICGYTVASGKLCKTVVS